MKRQKIVYRIPKMTTQLQKDIDDHKIYLVRGKTMPPSSQNCLNLNKEFGIDFYHFNKINFHKFKIKIFNGRISWVIALSLVITKTFSDSSTLSAGSWF